MTLLEERPGPPPPTSWPTAAAPGVESIDDNGYAVPAPAAETGAEALIRAVVVLLLFAIALVVVWKAFDQVVAPPWYRTRQHHLAADYAQPRPGLEPGQAAAVLQIPGISANLIVIEGSNPNELRSGPGHRIGTPLPGEKGNSIIEGHRTRWGAPFAGLPKLVKRTRVVAMDRSGIPVEYRVTTVTKVERSKLARYLAPSRDHRITLITHAGGAFSDDRFVVQAIAGTPSKRRSAAPPPALDPPAGSSTSAILALVLCLGLGGAAFVRLRRDHGLLALAMVAVPLAVGAVLALLLAIDTGLSSLL